MTDMFDHWRAESDRNEQLYQRDRLDVDAMELMHDPAPSTDNVRSVVSRLRQRVAELEADDDTTRAVIGRVEVHGSDWEIALAPDCKTWLTVPIEGCSKRPQIGDIVTIRKPRVLRIEADEGRHGR